VPLNGIMVKGIIRLMKSNWTRFMCLKLHFYTQ
jgi:hypothetical protein